MSKPLPLGTEGFDYIGWLYALHIVLCATFGQGFPSAASESEDRFLVTSESGATIGFIQTVSPELIQLSV